MLLPYASITIRSTTICMRKYVFLHVERKTIVQDYSLVLIFSQTTQPATHAAADTTTQVMAVARLHTHATACKRGITVC